MSLLAEVTSASCSSCAICSAVLAGAAALAAALAELAFFERVVEDELFLDAGILDGCVRKTDAEADEDGGDCGP